MTWDPGQYLRFDDLRSRPALDLINRIPDIEPADVWDLGCGTGEITISLARRWPGAVIHGLDSSAEMLDQARKRGGVDWVQGDIENWSPNRAPDVLFSNAALHWVGDHHTLFPRLGESVAPGGILAVQMPRNHDQPSHQILYGLARSTRWADRVGHLVEETPVATPATYHSLLSSTTTTIDIWETIYQQVLQGPDAVAEWTKGSVMRPYLTELGAEADGFFDEYAASLRHHYPPRGDGTTLFAFRRIFIVATR